MTKESTTVDELSKNLETKVALNTTPTIVVESSPATPVTPPISNKPSEAEAEDVEPNAGTYTGAALCQKKVACRSGAWVNFLVLQEK